MAYRQNHDPYYANQGSPYQQQPRHDYVAPPPADNTGVVDYSAPHNGYRNDQDHWDAKSAKSFQSSFAGSQAHLNPYEMSQVNVNAPPIPSMPYSQQQQYPPPQQRPVMFREQSTGWSVAKEKLMKRRSVKQVQLVRGNLVLDVPVPTHIVPAGKNDVEEFSKMRYTAATCDPDDFMSTRYSLRQYLWGRETELFIVMTMYNEDEILFAKTMNA